MAVILMGVWSGITVAVLNAVILEFHPGALPTGPVYNLIAEVSMIVGVVAAVRICRKARWGPVPTWVSATAAGASVRTLVMTLVNAAVLPQQYPVGFGLPESAVPGYLVLIGFFNFTVTLYTVPLAFTVSKAVVSRYRSSLGRDVPL